MAPFGKGSFWWKMVEGFVDFCAGWNGIARNRGGSAELRRSWKIRIPHKPEPPQAMSPPHAFRAFPAPGEDAQWPTGARMANGPETLRGRALRKRRRVAQCSTSPAASTAVLLWDPAWSRNRIDFETKRVRRVRNSCSE